MGSADLLKALKNHPADGAEADGDDARLTPYLSVVVAALCAMTTDGMISERDRSRLRSAIGADATVLERATDYLEHHGADDFLRDLPTLLDVRDRFCLLINVCDLLMVDGQLSGERLVQFDRLLGALGITKAGFQSYFNALSLKGRTSVLGDFSAPSASGAITPPMALLVAQAHMMRSDGGLGDRQIKRLGEASGATQHLLDTSIDYARRVGASEFLEQATRLLDARQRMCILANAGDILMGDRTISGARRVLFRRMLAAFGINGKDFDRHLNVFYLKNDLPPDDVDGRKLSLPLQRPAPEGDKGDKGEKGGRGEKGEDWSFRRERHWTEESGDAGDPEAAAAAATAAGAAASAVRPESVVKPFDRRASETGIGGRMPASERGLAPGRHEPPQGQSVSRDRPADNGDGTSDLRALRDSRSSIDAGLPAGAGLPHTRPLWKDADSSADVREMRDRESAADQRSMRDRESAGDQRSMRDRESAGDQRSMRDRESAGDQRSMRDSESAGDQRSMRDSESAGDQRTMRDSDRPGDQRRTTDLAGALPGKVIVDDRSAFDAAESDDPADVDGVARRMQAAADRTRILHDHIAAVEAVKSLREASRLPSLPELPAAPGAPAAVPEPSLATLEIGATEALATEDVTVTDEPGESHQMLLASDEGGPIIMSAGMESRTTEETRANQQLRRWSAALLPALSLTIGTTMIGEGMAERAFVTSENLATDAHIVHQMASVQQTIYRMVPDAVLPVADGLQAAAVPVIGSAGATVAAAGAAAMAPSQDDTANLSEREKADKFLERRKQELNGVFRQKQQESVKAAQTQEWFAYAKSMAILGLVMAFWGMLFRSMRSLHGATAVGLVSLLLTINGFWPILRF